MIYLHVYDKFSRSPLRQSESLLGTCYIGEKFFLLVAHHAAQRLTSFALNISYCSRRRRRRQRVVIENRSITPE